MKSTTGLQFWDSLSILVADKQKTVETFDDFSLTTIYHLNVFNPRYDPEISTPVAYVILLDNFIKRGQRKGIKSWLWVKQSNIRGLLTLRFVRNSALFLRYKDHCHKCTILHLWSSRMQSLRWSWIDSPRQHHSLPIWRRDQWPQDSGTAKRLNRPKIAPSL